jgi:bacillithiol biosynthesis cysteine-adding enzyme BshC
MSFQKTEIGFKDIEILSPLVSDYLAGDERLKTFYEALPDENGFRSLIEKRKNIPCDRKLLADVLAGQNSGAHASTKNNIKLLEGANTFTVTTGHQLNLFTGPLYFIYKVLSVLKLSIWLKEKFPGNNFIPVYWMASEDHDIAEINHTYLFGNKIEWNTSEKGAAGRLKCNGIDKVLEELETVTGSNVTADKLLAMLKNAYQEGRNLSEATRYLVNELFGKYGLVVIDPDDANLKRQFIPYMKEELLQESSFQKTSSTISALEKLNYEVQVTPREINLFYLQENSRERIVKEGTNFKVLNTSITWNEMEILSELEKNPERFSPNVVLRPLYQEVLLPNLAYTGGPAEIAYWLEYKSMFEHFKCSFPILVLRNCAMIADQVAGKKMEMLKISGKDIFKSVDLLSKEFIRNQQESFSMENEVAMVNNAFDLLQQKATAIDPTIAASVAGEKQRQLNAMTSLQEKIVRAEKKKHEVSLQKISKLKQKLFPEGSLQERHENFIPFYLEYGESFFDYLLEVFEPVSKQFHFLIASE